MGNPAILAWVEQPDEGILMLLVGGNATAFAQVTEPASERKVGELGRSTLLFAYNVIDVVAGESYGLRHATILATIVGRGSDLPAKDDGDVGLAHAFIRRP